MRSEFLATGIGYIYRVGDEEQPDLLTIEVTNVRNRAGSTYALLTTSTTLPHARVIPGTDRVLNGEVWLLSHRSRNEYADSLTRLIPAPNGAAKVDFSAVLEEMAQRVIEHQNAPVPITPLQPKPVRPSQQYLIEGILPKGKATILYGAGGVGKSILAATMAVCVQTGRRFLGLAGTQAEVLYLDWETDEEDIAARVQAVSHGMALPMPALRYSSLVRPIEEQAPSLARVVAEQGIGLVVIDSVGMAMSSARDGGDPSDTAIRFFRALRSLNAAILAIDHVSGDDMRRKGAAKPYGSVYKWNSARNAYELRERKEPDRQGSHLLLKHRKTNLGRLLPDLPLRLQWDEAAGMATFQRERFEPESVQPLPEQILDILAVAPASPRQIAEFLSSDDTLVNEIDVRRELKVLIGAGKVNAGGDGQMRTVTDKPPVAESPQLPMDE